MRKSAAVQRRLQKSHVLFGALAVLGIATSAQALQFELDYGDGISGTLNTSVTLGAGIRMQDRAPDLVGRANLHPEICGVRTPEGGASEINFASCQGINQNDILPAQSLTGIVDSLGAVGQYSPNFDNGNLAYDKHDLIQAPLKITQDISVTYNDFGFFGRWIYFYDFVNNSFEEYRPNVIGLDQEPNGPEAIPLTGPTYMSGTPHYLERTDSNVLEQIGTDLQMMDAYVYGFFPLPGDRELTLKVGRQSLSWGESTLLVINSLNQSNPVSANNLFRTGFVPEEVFLPVGMFYASTGITDNLSIETFYQYEWGNVEAPPPGTYFSFTDIGPDNMANHVQISFGGNPEDPYRRGTPLNNALSGLTDTTTTIIRHRDNEPSDSGQWGLSFKYFAEDFNNGTDFGFYFMNYHSKLPFASFYATELSCARTHPNDMAGTGSAVDADAFNLATLLLACPNLPAAEQLAANLAPLDSALLDTLGGVVDDLSGFQLIGTGEVTDAVPLDGASIQLEYPEDLKLYGMSFNTTMGDLSIQGELAYRPNMPVQVDAEDLTFAALGPTLASCHRALHPDMGGQTCNDGLGLSQSGPNTFNLIPPTPDNPPTGNGGDAPSVQRSFPAFITSYRGITLGENDPHGYIRGWEHVKALQYNLGATYILGKTDNPIGADQVIMFFEAGATQILNMPEKHLYQIDAPGTHLHASAGVVNEDPVATDDDSVSWQQRRMDSPGCFPGICVAGTDGMRFNPKREELQYTTGFSWGYRIITLLRYESILPGISLQPFIVLAHDVNGIAPGPGENFIEGRKNFLINFEIRYKSAWSFNPGYAWWTGGGSQNLYRDRDFAHFYIRYQF